MIDVVISDNHAVNLSRVYVHFVRNAAGGVHRVYFASTSIHASKRPSFTILYLPILEWIQMSKEVYYSEEMDMG